MLNEKEKEFAVWLAKEIVRISKKSNDKSSDAVLNENIAKDTNINKENIKNNLTSSYSKDFKNLDIGLSIYGFRTRTLGEDFIKTYSSGELKNNYSCSYFLTQNFLKEGYDIGFNRRIRTSPAYFTYFELSTPVVNPIFIQDGNNILSILLDTSVKELKDITDYEKYVITKSNEQYFQENDIVGLKDYHELKRQGRDIEFATGSEAIKHLLSNFDPSATLQEIKNKYINNEKNIPEKIQKRIKVLEYFIYNQVETQKILISILPVPQINILLRNATKQTKTEVRNMYLDIACMSDRVVDLVNIGAPVIVINNQRKLLQLAVTRLFRKCLKVYLCQTQILHLENIEINELDSDFLISEHKKETMSLFGISKESDLYAWVHFISMLFCMEINEYSIKNSSLYDFLWEHNAIEDKDVWNRLVTPN